MFLTVIESAELLGCSAQHVRKLLREERLTGQKYGDSWLIPKDEIENFDKKDLRLKTNDIPDRKAKRKVSSSKLNCLSFFSGAMGLDIGLEKAGINVLLSCEIDNASRKTIVHNDSKIGLIGDIRNYTIEEILEYGNVKTKDEVDLIVGGPPCQAFSSAGKRMGFQDERGNVFLKYIELIASIKPKYAVIENVRGLLSTSYTIDIEDDVTKEFHPDWKKHSGSALFYVKKRLENAGYHVKFNLYNSANFGTPQIRERVVIICTRLDSPVPYLEPTHSQHRIFGLKPWRTFKDAVQGLDPINCDHIKFSEKRLKYLRMLKAGQNWKDLPPEIQPVAMGNSYLLGGGKTGFYRRLAWERPAPTVVTHPAMPATELAHPEYDRPLSIQEYKRIQEFPDDWMIQGNLIDQYKQVGNAVPVGLGYAIAKAIVKHYQGGEFKNIQGFQFSRYLQTSDKEWTTKFSKFEEGGSKVFGQISITI